MKSFQYALSLVSLLFIALLICIPKNAYNQTDSLNISSYEAAPLTKKEKKAERKAKNKELNKAYLKGNHFDLHALFTYASLESSISFEGKNGILGASLSLETLLGFEKNKFVPSLDFKYSFTRHSAIYAEYLDISRSTTYNVSEEFDWNDIPILEDAGEVKLYLNTQIASVGYMYSFINTKKADLAFFVNIYIMRVGTGIDVDKQNVHEDIRFTVPLPSIGYRINYELFPRFRFGATQSLFILRINDFYGRINNLNVFFDYRIAKWFSCGLAYSVFSLNVQVDNTNYNGIIDYGYNGLGLFMEFNF